MLIVWSDAFECAAGAHRPLIYVAHDMYGQLGGGCSWVRSLVCDCTAPRVVISVLGTGIGQSLRFYRGLEWMYCKMGHAAICRAQVDKRWGRRRSGAIGCLCDCSQGQALCLGFVSAFLLADLACCGKLAKQHCCCMASFGRVLIAMVCMTTA